MMCAVLAAGLAPYGVQAATPQLEQPPKQAVRPKAPAPAPMAAKTPDRPMKRLLLNASSWSLQFQNTSVDALAATHYDILVLDADIQATPADIERLKRKPTGQRRIVLSYLSVGESVTYRPYWKRCCEGRGTPAWQYTKNDRWNSFRVRFWHPEWKDIVYAGPQSELGRIIDRGFDGVFLDRVDVYPEVPAPGIDTAKEMAHFVSALREAAAQRQPDFLIIGQNAENLLADPTYLNAIDAISKEDLFYGVPGEGKRNTTEMIRFSTRALQKAAEAGKGIFVIEYLQNPAVVDPTRNAIMELGFVPVFLPRDLHKLQIEDLADSHGD